VPSSCPFQYGRVVVQHRNRTDPSLFIPLHTDRYCSLARSCPLNGDRAVHWRIPSPHPVIGHVTLFSELPMLAQLKLLGLALMDTIPRDHPAAPHPILCPLMPPCQHHPERTVMFWQSATGDASSSMLVTSTSLHSPCRLVEKSCADRRTVTHRVVRSPSVRSVFIRRPYRSLSWACSQSSGREGPRGRFTLPFREVRTGCDW
jgi:hypothetical protein